MPACHSFVNPCAFVTALLAVVLATPLRAQNPGPPPVTVSLRLLAFTPGCACDSVYLHDPFAPAPAPGRAPAVQGTKTEIKSYLNHETVTMRAYGRRLVITGQADPASATKASDILCSIQLPEHVRSAIVLVFPGADGATPPMNSITLNDSTAAFPRGSLLVLNRSPQPVELRLEAKRYDFKPLQSQLVVDPPTGAGGQSAMNAFAFANGEWKRIGAGIWPHPGDRRALQIFFHNPVTGTVELRSFRDIAVRDDPPPAPPP